MPVDSKLTPTSPLRVVRYGGFVWFLDQGLEADRLAIGVAGCDRRPQLRDLGCWGALTGGIILASGGLYWLDPTVRS